MEDKFIIKHSHVIVHMTNTYFGFMVDVNGDHANWFYATVISAPANQGEEWILKHEGTGLTVYVNPQSSAYIGMMRLQSEDDAE